MHAADRLAAAICVRARETGDNMTTHWRAAIGLSALILAPGLCLAQAPPADAKPTDMAELKAKVAQQDQLIQQLLEANKKLTERLDKLEKGPGGAKPGEEPPIPDLELPGGKEPGKPAAADTGAAPGARATLMPDLAVIGNHTGRFFSAKGDPDRNRFQLGEIELALEQPVYTGIKFKAQLAAGAEEGFGMAAEEAYIEATNLFGSRLAGTFGRKRISFGKVNPLHPHSRPYVDQPAPLALLVHPEALSGNGGSVEYLLPIKNVFSHLQFGFHSTEAAEDTAEVARGEATASYPGGLGVNGNLASGRLWLSREFGKSAELELGGSHVFGKGENGDKLSLTGVDLTLRQFPGTFKRLQLQSEAFWHQRKDRSLTFDGGNHTRFGHYTLLSWAPDQYHEFGLRYDNSQYPWPLPGREESMSLIWTNRMTEVTLLRFQYKHGNRSGLLGLPEANGFNEFYLQFIWGAGSHTHPLQ